jgi:hypothetical protein
MIDVSLRIVVGIMDEKTKARAHGRRLPRPLAYLVERFASKPEKAQEKTDGMIKELQAALAGNGISKEPVLRKAREVASKEDLTACVPHITRFLFCDSGHRDDDIVIKRLAAITLIRCAECQSDISESAVYLLKALHDPDVFEASSAALGQALINPKSRNVALAALADDFMNADPKVREGIVMAAGRAVKQGIGSNVLMAMINESLHDEDERVRETARRTISEIK